MVPRANEFGANENWPQDRIFTLRPNDLGGAPDPRDVECKLEVASALANAVAQALAPLGVKVTSLPLNPNKIRRLLREAGH